MSYSKVFQSVDAPVAPSTKGVGVWTNELSLGDLRLSRERLLQVQSQDLLRVAEKYLVSNLVRSDCIIGPTEHLIHERNDPDHELAELNPDRKWNHFKLS